VVDFRKPWNEAFNAAKVPRRIFRDLRSVAMSISGHKTVSMFLRYNISNGADKLDALKRTAPIGQRSPKSRIPTSRRCQSGTRPCPDENTHKDAVCTGDEQPVRVDISMCTSNSCDVARLPGIAGCAGEYSRLTPTIQPRAVSTAARPSRTARRSTGWPIRRHRVRRLVRGSPGLPRRPC
jgi:hypothetical protein